MSDYDDGTNDGNDGGPADLRKALEKANKKFNDLQAEYAKLQAKASRQDAVEVLATLKLSPKIAKLIPSDVERTEDGIKAWVEEFGDVFNVSLPTDDGSTDGGSKTQSAGTTASEEFVSGFRQMTDTAAVGAPPRPDPKGHEEFLANLQGADMRTVMDAFTRRKTA